jgi:hypothetical protein
LAAAFGIGSNMLGALYLDRIRLVMALACGAVLAAAAVAAVRRRDARALGLFAALGSAAGGLFVASQFTPVMLERTSLFLLAFALSAPARAGWRSRAPRCCSPCTCAGPRTARP